MAQKNAQERRTGSEAVSHRTLRVSEIACVRAGRLVVPRPRFRITSRDYRSARHNGTLFQNVLSARAPRLGSPGVMDAEDVPAECCG